MKNSRFSDSSLGSMSPKISSPRFFTSTSWLSPLIKSIKK